MAKKIVVNKAGYGIISSLILLAAACGPIAPSVSKFAGAKTTKGVNPFGGIITGSENDSSIVNRADSSPKVLSTTTYNNTYEDLIDENNGQELAAQHVNTFKSSGSVTISQAADFNSFVTNRPQIHFETTGLGSFTRTDLESKIRVLFEAGALGLGKTITISIKAPDANASAATIESYAEDSNTLKQAITGITVIFMDENIDPTSNASQAHN